MDDSKWQIAHAFKFGTDAVKRVHMPDLPSDAEMYTGPKTFSKQS